MNTLLLIICALYIAWFSRYAVLGVIMVVPSEWRTVYPKRSERALISIAYSAGMLAYSGALALIIAEIIRVRIGG